MEQNTTDRINPDAIIGHNAPPDHGKIAYDALAEKYAPTVQLIDQLNDEAKKLGVIDDKTPLPVINTEEEAAAFTKLYKRMSDVHGQLKDHHTVEKEPYYRGGQGVDKFCFGFMRGMFREKKTDKKGIADLLYEVVDNLNQRKLAAERERRRKEAEEAAERERVAARARADADAKAKEAADAATRARKPANIEKHQEDAATHAAAGVSLRDVENERRADLAQALSAASAKPADMVRARLNDDTILTAAEVTYCEVYDVAALDKDALWSFVDDKAKIRACERWAEMTRHKKQMTGASIGHRAKTVIR